jgi:hypothetical protein
MSRTPKSRDNQKNSRSLASLKNAAALTLFAAVLAGCAPSQESPIETPSTSQPAEPTTPVEVTPSNEPEQPAEKDYVKPELIEEYDAMELSEFQRLPIEKRLEYTAWYFQDAREYAAVYYEESKDPADIYPDEISINNTPEEIMSILTTQQRMVFSVVKNGVTPAPAVIEARNALGVKFDDTAARKLLSASSTNISSIYYRQMMSKIDEMTGSKPESARGLGVFKGLQGSTIISASKLDTSKQYPTMTIKSYYNGNPDLTATFVAQWIESAKIWVYG